MVFDERCGNHLAPARSARGRPRSPRFWRYHGHRSGRQNHLGEAATGSLLEGDWCIGGEDGNRCLSRMIGNPCRNTHRMTHLTYLIHRELLDFGIAVAVERPAQIGETRRPTPKEHCRHQPS